MQTRCRKLKVIDTTYVFRVPVETSLDPLDIIKAGRVVTIKVGMKPIEDVNGNILGTSGRGGNGIKEMIVEPSTEIKDALIESIKKTRRIIEAEQKNPDTTVLRQLSVHKHRGELIRRETEKGDYYFIPSKAYCDNCRQPIQGITELEININGKVGKELPFKPTEPAVQHNYSKKWLHIHCAAKSCVEPEKSEECHCDRKEDYTEPPTHKKDSPEELLVTILKRQDLYSAEFARGASLMYACFKEIR